MFQNALPTKEALPKSTGGCTYSDVQVASSLLLFLPGSKFSKEPLVGRYWQVNRHTYLWLPYVENGAEGLSRGLLVVGAALHILWVPEASSQVVRIY